MEKLGHHELSARVRHVGREGITALKFPTMTRRMVVGLVGAYTFLALLFTYPLILHLSTGIGGVSVDAEQFLWSYWWFYQSLVVQHTTPFWTNMLYYPEGVSLHFFTTNTFHALLSIPLQALVGLVPAYNVLVIATLVVSAFGAAWLAYDVSESYAGAFIAGIAWGFAPIQMFHWRVGQANMLSVECVPLYICCLRRALQLSGLGRTQLRWVLAAALALVCAVLNDWQYGVYLGLCSIVLVLAMLYAQHQAWQWVLGMACAVALLAVLVLLPYIVPLVVELAGPEPYMVRSVSDTIAHSADLLAFAVPNPAHPLWGAWATQQLDGLTPSGIIQTVVSLSYVTVVLALIGTLYAWRQARFWWLLGLIFWVLSLGPELRVLGEERALPLPYAILFQLKVMQVSRFPGRFVLITILCLALLAALGVREICRRHWLLARRPTLLTALIGGLLVFELWPTPRYVEPLSAAPSFFTDHSLDNAGAIWEAANPSNRGMYYATLHSHPVLYGELSRDNPPGPVLNYLRNGPFRDEIILSPSNWACSMRFFNIHDLIVYHRVLEAEDQQRGDQIMAQLGRQALVRDTPEATWYHLADIAQDSTCLVVGADWSTPRELDAPKELYRWIGQASTLGVLRREPGQVQLSFTAHSFAQPRHFQVRNQGQLLQEFMINVTPQPFVLTLDLPAGQTWLDLRPVEPAQSPQDFGYPESDPVSIGIGQLAVHEISK